MRYSNLFKVALVATTFFTTSSTLFAGKGDEAIQSESASTVSIPAKLSIKDQLGLDYVNFSMRLMQWDREQKEKTETATTVTVPGLQIETREQAALRILIEMADGDKHTPLHHALANKQADFTRLFLAVLGEEANSPELMTEDRRSLLNFLTTRFQNEEALDDSVFGTLIALKESHYKFNNKEITHFPEFRKQNRTTCASLTFREEYRSNQHVALAILLGADKEDVSIHVNHTSSTSHDYEQRLQRTLISLYKTLSKNGLAHLIDIDEYMKARINLNGTLLNFKKLQEQSTVVRQKKSQIQQLNEALERISKK